MKYFYLNILIYYFIIKSISFPLNSLQFINYGIVSKTDEFIFENKTVFYMEGLDVYNQQNSAPFLMKKENNSTKSNIFFFQKKKNNYLIVPPIGMRSSVALGKKKKILIFSKN